MSLYTTGNDTKSQQPVDHARAGRCTMSIPAVSWKLTYPEKCFELSYHIQIIFFEKELLFRRFIPRSLCDRAGGTGRHEQEGGGVC